MISAFFFAKTMCFTSENMVFLKMSVFLFFRETFIGSGQAGPGPWASQPEDTARQPTSQPASQPTSQQASQQMDFLKDSTDFLKDSMDFLKDSIDFLQDSMDFLKDSIDFLKDSIDFLCSGILLSALT